MRYLDNVIGWLAGMRNGSEVGEIEEPILARAENHSDLQSLPNRTGTYTMPGAFPNNIFQQNIVQNNHSLIIPLSQCIQEEIEQWGSRNRAKKWVNYFNRNGDIEDILLLLEKLRKSTKNRSLNLIRQRVREVLKKLEEEKERGEEELFIKCVELAKEANATCEDKALIGLENIEFSMIEHDALKGKYDWQELLKIGKRACREIEVRRITQQVVEKQIRRIEEDNPGADQQVIEGLVDPAEIYLKLMIELKKNFDLPIKSDYMEYSTTARLTPNDINRAEKKLRALENSAEMFAFLSKYPPWQAYLHRERVKDFEKALRPLTQEQEKLEDENEGGKIDYTESEYGERMIAIGKAREAMEFMQATNLTRTYLLAESSAILHKLLTYQPILCATRLQILYPYIEKIAYQLALYAQQYSAINQTNARSS